MTSLRLSRKLDRVAHALLRAASPLMATPGQGTQGVETSLDTARTSARATAGRYLLAGLLVTLAGCGGVQRDPPFQLWPDMKLQEKFKPQLTTTLFPDGRESRRPPEGAIARGHMNEDTPFNTGMDGKLYVGKNPLQITDAVIEEGHWRFNTYCSPCHDRTGLGKGMVPKRWPAWQPQNLMEDQVVQKADGDIFYVITYGRRTMPPYYEQNHPEDRWAIIAYLRVLQRAAHASMDDVPPELRSTVEYKGQ